MRVTLIEQRRLSHITLPDKPNGRYWVERTDPMGKRERALSIEGSDGGWMLRSGRHSTLLNREMAECREQPLGGGDCVSVRFRRTGETALLLAEQLAPRDMAFRKYIVPVHTTLTLGADPSCDIAVSGSPFIAPQHLQLECGGEGIFLRCMDGRYGAYVNGDRVEQARLQPGDVLYVMGFSLIAGKGFVAVNRAAQVQVSGGRLMPLALPPAAAMEEEDFFDDMPAENVFVRSPRFKRDIAPAELNLDPPPSPLQEEGNPLLLTVGPAITMAMASLFMAWFAVNNAVSRGGNIMTALPSVIMACSMMLGSLLWPTLTRKYTARKRGEQEKLRHKKYYAYLEKVKGRIAREAEHQAAVLHENLIPLSACLRRIELRERTLWERMPEHNDFLQVRLGLGNLPLLMQLKHPPESFTVEEDDLRDAMYLLAKEPRVVQNVPVSVRLTQEYVTGVIGSRSECVPFIRNLLFQMAALHSYQDLKIAFLYDETEEPGWDFVRWFPHCWSEEESLRFVAGKPEEYRELSAYFERMFSARREQKAVAGPHYVFFAISRSLARQTEMIGQVLAMEEYRGFAAVLAYDELKYLPRQCDKVIHLEGASSRIYDRGDVSGKQQAFLPDVEEGFSPHKTAAALANIRLEQVDKAYVMPSMLTFMEMMGAERIEHLNPLERWRENNPVHSLRAPIGVMSTGDLFYLDLHEKFHGPHGLVAGTTGSGKSEFIMTFILSLALNYHPHEVAFILIDYKGGGMASAFTALPHLAGTITNLDGAAVNRSLVSIQSELRRRQTIFRETGEQVGVSNVDIYKYQKLYREGAVSEPLQHLFIISDEFAELKSQQPEFMAQLVSAARIGRSLGIHLILATQKPSGVVDDQIWSNSRFRVCLKVQETSDSQEVIKRPDAASLSVTGRFYVQVGMDELFELGQSAWAGAPYQPGVTAQRDDGVAFLDRLGRVTREVRPARKTKQAENPPKQLDEITGYLRRLADEEQIRVRPLWKEPIPPLVFVDDLEKRYGYAPAPFVLEPVIGEYDNPMEQSQHLLTLPLGTGGNVLLYGSSGSGKALFLATVIDSLLRHHRPEEVNLYLLDYGNEMLRVFRGAPQVGDVLFSSDEEKLDNLLRMLHGELLARRKRFADYGGDYQSYCKVRQDVPRIVVAINNFAALNEMYEEKVTEELTPLTREGFKLGILFVVACNSVNDIRYRMQQNFGQVYCLQMNDPSDYYMLFPGADRIVPAAHTGRGLCKTDSLYEFQTAYAAPPDDMYTLLKAKSDQMGAAHTGSRAPAVPMLPQYCDLAFLAPHLPGEGIPIGVDRLSLGIIRNSFSAYLNLVGYNNADGVLFMQSVAELLARKGEKVMAIDIGEAFRGSFSFPCEQGFVRAREAANNLALEIVNRNNAWKRSMQEGKPVPEFDRRYVVIYDIAALIAALEGEDRSYFEQVLLRGRPNYGIHIILSSPRLADIGRMEWFAKQVHTDSFIWVGSGINDQGYLRVSGSTLDLRQMIPDDFGYVVERTKYRVAKLAVPDGTLLEQEAATV